MIFIVIARCGHMYIAHISQDGRRQPLSDHLANTAKLAEQFASVFGAGPWGRLVGELHDIGKAGKQWQSALLQGSSLSMDHSIAGAQEAAEFCGLMAAYCIAGHHSGLPNGEQTPRQGATLLQCLQKKIPELPPIQGLTSIQFPSHPQIKPLGKGGFSVSFFIRMLYSCLVDADLLDTERFLTQGKTQQLPYDDILNILGKLTISIKSMFPPGSKTNELRTRLLQSCAEQAERSPGLFTLTAPSGCGTSVSSLYFALRHSVKYNKRRVITVLPFSSFLDQTVWEYQKLLGDQNIICHAADWGNDDREDTPQAPPSSMRFASDNWDAPIVITTNQSFFESFYSNQAFSCRKLHNIANSVILINEAQLIPLPMLYSCMRVLGELVYNYGCTVVLYGIMPAPLKAYLPTELHVHELCPFYRDLSAFYRQIQVVFLGKQSNEMIVNRLMNQNQALCIVNTCEQACSLYKRTRGEGCYLVTSLLYPEHRLKILAEIKQRLASGKTCRVIATGIAEIGMDVNFPSVYRAQAGLDRLIQAAGLCSRDNRYARQRCTLSVFRPEEKYRDSQLPLLSLSLEALDTVVHEYEFPCSTEALMAYYRELYRQMERLYPDQIVDVLDQGIRGCRFPFANVAQDQHFFAENLRSVLIPAGSDGIQIVQRLRSGERNRDLMRNAGRFMIFLAQKHWDMLNRENVLDVLDSELAVLNRSSCYLDTAGLAMSLFYWEED